jgi:two-component system OmpR family response regulator
MSKMDNIKNVLLVDDDANITFLTEMALEGLTDWHIEIARSGEEALRKVQEQKPDLILLDIMMPVMDGLTVFAKLKENSALASTCILFVTAKVQSQEIDQYLRLGVDGVITKPFDPITLPEEIERIVSGAQRLKEKVHA